jgi:hypothetical protein
MNASMNGNTDDDVDEHEDGVKVDLNEDNEKEVMSPGARARAVSLCPLSSPSSSLSLAQSMGADKQDHARLLAPALHMSHLNSPTGIKFKLPLSPMPMRKLKEAEQGMTSPIYRGPGPIPLHAQEEFDEQRGDSKKGKEETPVFSFSCDSPPSTAEAVGVWLDDQQKQKSSAESNDTEGGEDGGQVISGQVLEVHVETVD